MLVPLIRSRLMESLEGMPTVAATLIDRLDADSPLWDRGFDPERFTLREVFAHLVDYDKMWHEYLDKALAATNGPTEVPLYTPDAFAALRDYSATVPQESLHDLRASRTELVAKLRALDADAWVNHAIHSPRHGHLNVDELATLFVAHDGYHTRQVAEYVSAT